jgi:mannose-6-phosphate isomerase-like protein (cupin superfamily)
MAPRFGLAPDVEARFPKRELGSRTGTVSLQRLAPNARFPFGHRHAGQEEHYVILDGAGRMNLDGEVIEVRRWDAIRVTPETTRAFEAGPEGLEVLAFGAPIGEENDAEMVPGWWAE